MSFFAMRYLLSFLVVSVETGLVVGKPIHDGTLESRKAPHEIRDVQNGDSVLDVVASKLTILGLSSCTDEV
jgi:hypothetical protein